MQGPTPVSSLLHAASMVTVGVFLILRLSFLFENLPDVLMVIAFLGSLTAFFAATTGAVQNDIKATIAYSTASQLGYMVASCGLSNYNVALFHLITHGFFKALLFLSAGAIIHGLADEQDIRKMGSLAQVLPVSYACILIGSLSLMGFPFLSGFFSKDAILEIAAASYKIEGTFAYVLLLLAALFTAFYSFRLIFFVFLSEANGLRPVYKQAHEANVVMIVPITVLAFGAIFLGYMFKDLMIGAGSSFLTISLGSTFAHHNLIDSEFLPTSIKLVPLVLSLSGAALALVLYRQEPALAVNLKTGFSRIFAFLTHS